MKQIYQRTVALLLAVVLCFSMFPATAFAAETGGGVSSGITEETVTKEMPPVDEPVVYAMDPVSDVVADLGHGTKYLTEWGVTRQAIINELSAHEHDDYYLGTPYIGGDWQSPNGDTSYNGRAGMNCAGFVAYVLKKCGLDGDALVQYLYDMNPGGELSLDGSGLAHDLLSGASNIYRWAQYDKLKCFVYATKEEMLADQKLEKGDIILMHWSHSPFADGADNHIGFFWGNKSDENLFWHSSTHPKDGNQISTIEPKTEGSTYVVIKLEESRKVVLNKTSADATITNYNGEYSLAGAVYNVYAGAHATGTPVATFTTDANGHAELEKPLANGTYSVKEAHAPKGYLRDENIYTFNINGTDVTLNVQDDPGTISLQVVKKDSGAGAVPQGSASLAGAVYRVTYRKNGQTVTVEGTTNAQGYVDPPFRGIPFGPVTVQEIKAPKGYKLDTTVHTYQVGAPDNVTDVYELEPEDLTEEVIRGGISVEKRDIITGGTPQGDASFAGIKFEIVNRNANPVVVGGQTYAPGAVVATLTTNNTGKASTANNALPFGQYEVRESSTNSSMLRTFQPQTVTITEDKKVYSIIAGNDVLRGGISVEKRDAVTGTTPQGNASFAGITFEVVNRGANPVTVGGRSYASGAVVTTLTTDNTGRASTANDVLPFGQYEIREAAANNSMLPTFQPQTVTISENRKVYHITAENDVLRGGVSVEKWDADTGSTPQGDTSFAGIKFEIINKSRESIVVDGNSYAPDDVVMELTTDSEGKVSTANDALPYGEYLLHESATNDSMLLTAADQRVVISENRKVYNFVAENEAIKGKIGITKHTDNSGATQIETPEVGAEFEVYLSAAGSYDKANPTDRDVIVIDENGYGETTLLPYGVYTVHQIKSWAGREMIPDFQVFISEDGKTYPFIINNRAGESLIQIVKKDSETGRVIPASGIGFQIKDVASGKFVFQHINYPTPMDLSVFYTDVTGRLMLPSPLIYGEYELYETQSAYGYVLDAEPVHFFVDGTAKELVVEKRNQPQKGVLVIEKTGEVLDKTEEKGDYTVPVYKKAGLAGVEFTITAAEDIKTPDGSLRYAMGKVIQTIVTDDNGHAETTPLYLGSYWVQETKGKDGYALDSQKKLVTLKYTNQKEDVQYKTLELENRRRELRVKKVDSRYNGVTLTGAAFEVWQDVDGNKKLDKETDTRFGELTEVEKGIYTLSYLPVGGFFLVETKAPDLYALKEKPEYFEVRSADVEIERTVRNQPQTGTLELVKTSENGVVEGFTFLVTGKTSLGGDYSREFTTDENGRFEVDDLLVGEYTVTEVLDEHSVRYVQPDAQSVSIEYNKTAEVHFFNKLRRGEVYVIKTDEDYPESRLDSAKFLIWKDLNDNKTYDEGEPSVGTLHEDEGLYWLDGLETGSYLLREEVAPEGYIRDYNYYPFYISDDKVQVEVVNTPDPDKGFVNRPMKGSLTIVKKSASGVHLKGANFAVTTKGGEIVADGTTDEDGVLVFEDLPLGDYIYYEVCAPSGYETDSTKHSFSITATKLEVEVEALNVQTPFYVPKTGDGRLNPTFWGMAALSALVAGLGGILAIEIYRRKNKNR